jgi:Zn-dependent protease with chaperone function
VAAYVAPTLDPNWQNPYAPSKEERESHRKAVVTAIVSGLRLRGLLVGAVVLALLVGVVWQPLLAVVALVVGGLFAYDAYRRISSAESKGQKLGDLMLATFAPGGTPVERRRLLTVLDRLAATFGVNEVSAFIVSDPTYNAALVPNGESFALYVTSALMRDFELSELEGVVAHLLARHRLGVLPREAASAVLALNADKRRALAGSGLAYRADEVAAAAIRYPLGLASALRKCARQVVSVDSFFATATYDQWRYVFFDMHSDRRDNDIADLDDVELRAMALEEW